LLLPEMSDLVVCKNTVCHCGGKEWACPACITYPRKCKKQRSKWDKCQAAPPLCDECLPYLRRKLCAECASGAICSSSPVQDLESAVEALSFAVANLVHAARMCALPPPLQQAGPGSSNDDTPAPKREPVGAHAAAAPVYAEWALAAAFVHSTFPEERPGGKATAVRVATAADAPGKGPPAPGLAAAAPVGTAPSLTAQVAPVIPADRGACGAAVRGATAADAPEDGARAPVEAAAAQVGPAPFWQAPGWQGAAAASAAEGWYYGNWEAGSWP
jgi:hypothetical protein